MSSFAGGKHLVQHTLRRVSAKADYNGFYSCEPGTWAWDFRLASLTWKSAWYCYHLCLVLNGRSVRFEMLIIRHNTMKYIVYSANWETAMLQYHCLVWYKQSLGIHNSGWTVGHFLLSVWKQVDIIAAIHIKAADGSGGLAWLHDLSESPHVLNTGWHTVWIRKPIQIKRLFSGCDGR